MDRQAKVRAVIAAEPYVRRIHSMAFRRPDESRNERLMREFREAVYEGTLLDAVTYEQAVTRLMRFAESQVKAYKQRRRFQRTMRSYLTYMTIEQATLMRLRYLEEEPEQSICRFMETTPARLEEIERQAMKTIHRWKRRWLREWREEQRELRYYRSWF